MKHTQILKVTALLAALSVSAQEPSIPSQGSQSGQRQGQRQTGQQSQSSSSTNRTGQAQSSQSQYNSGQSSTGQGAPASSQTGQLSPSSSSQQDRYGSTSSSQPGKSGQSSSGINNPSASSGASGSAPGIGSSGASSTGIDRSSQSSSSQYSTTPSSSGQLSQPSSSSSQSGLSSSTGIGAPGSSATGQSASGSLNAQVNQQHVTQLTQAFGTMRGGTGGAANSQQLTQAITAIAPAGRGSSTYVNRFVTDLSAVLPTVTLAAPAQQRLATAIAYVMSPTFEVAQLEPVMTQVRQVLVESGVSPVAAQTVACDLHLIAAENNPNLLEVKVNR